MADQSKIRELMKEYGQLERQAKALFKKANDAHAKLWASPEGSAEAKRYNAEWKRLEAEGVKFREKANRILDRVERMKKENPTRRRNKTIITKPKKVVVINKLKANPKTKRLFKVTGIDARGLHYYNILPSRAEAQSWAKKNNLRRVVITEIKPSGSIANSAKSTRRKYRNGYLDLVIMGHAKKTPSGWLLGGKTFKQGKGIVPASKRGYYLDRATGTVFSKKARNSAKKRNLDHRDAQHPIHVTDYWQGRKGYMTPWQRAHHAGQTDLFAHGIKPVKKRNPRYLVIGIDERGREYDLAVHVDANKTQTLAWAKRRYPGYKKYAISLSDKADYIGRSGMVKAKRPKRLGKRNPQYTVEAIPKYTSTVKKDVKALTRGSAIRKVQRQVEGPKNAYRYRVEKNPKRAVKRNPSPADNRREFAGSYTGDKKLRFPDGTPSGLSKLGTLKLIKTEAGTLKPSQGTAWLCRDQKGKLHIGTTRLDGVVYNGNAGNLGRVEMIEYDETKKHLYPNSGRIRFYHKMGEEDGKQPVLYSDGKGGLKFKGGNYRIESRGIVN